MTEKVESALGRFVERHSPVRDEMTLLILVGDKGLFKPPMRPGDEPTWTDVLVRFLCHPMNQHLDIKKVKRILDSGEKV